MAAQYRVIYHPQVIEDDLPKPSSDIKKRIKKSIEGKLISNPEEFGEPLRRTLKGYWKLRVGNYRIIFKATSNEIIIFRIGHRKEIYTSLRRRI